MPIEMSNTVFLAGTSSKKLCAEIFKALDIPQKATHVVTKFADGEIFIKILDTIRGRDVNVSCGVIFHNA